MSNDPTDPKAPPTDARSTAEEVRAWREALYKTGPFVNATQEALRHGLAAFVITSLPSPLGKKPKESEHEPQP